MLVWREATKQQQGNTIHPLIFLLWEKWLDHMKNHTQFLPLLNPHLSHKQSGIFHGHNVVPACICTTQPARSSTCGLCYLRTALHLQRLWAIPSEANGSRFHLNTYLPAYFSPSLERHRWVWLVWKRTTACSSFSEGEWLSWKYLFADYKNEQCLPLIRSLTFKQIEKGDVISKTH